MRPDPTERSIKPPDVQACGSGDFRCDSCRWALPAAAVEIGRWATSHAMKLLALVLALVTSPAFRVTAQDTVSVTGADVMEVGIYTARIIKTFDVPGVVRGTNQGLDSFALVQATTNVPARVGTRFGFRYTIHGTPSNAPIVLTMVGEHPPLKDPKTGKSQTKDEYELPSWIGQTYTSYSFDEQWELIPGTWKFEIWHKGKKLCEQSFKVVTDTKPKDNR